jgi:apolipoprotein D and lipocalin family protein
MFHPLFLSRRAACIGAVIAGLSACTSPPSSPLSTVAEVDLARYGGAWYEIASVPNRFQAQCVADTQARYRPQGNDIEVLNRCRKADGTVEDITGVAKVVAGSGNAKLRVSFFWPFYGDYWVLALAPDYRWVLVGEPSRRYGWVLARAPVLSRADFDEALGRAAALGYEPAAFRLTPQTRPLE